MPADAPPAGPATGALPDPNANLLARATSPYLLQHADNPVAWRPWGPEALAEAKARNVPILLSVGYAACHWCHVMAHESFEDPSVAAELNPRFVPVKVDREERPDIDGIYQAALAMTGQQGGWPLTMFLTPDGEPFWGGTYFPRHQRYGRPGFVDILKVLSEAWVEESDQIRGNVAALRQAMTKLSQSAAGDGPTIMHADMVADRLLQEIDTEWGGIGSAPKFPQPSILELLWRHWHRTEKPAAKTAVVDALTRMAEGGLYDHLRGGFARYSTDREWLAPHFEKMLYDNAQLIDVMTLVWRDTKDPLLAARIAETVDWIAAEMIAPGGGFAATLDADSEGEEGRFYVWDKAEIDRLLGDRAAPFAAVYDVTDGGNWEGKTILNRRLNPGWRGEAEEAALAEDLAVLLEARSHRVRPGWDDKVLADWNGLAIAALAEAARVFDRPDWLAMAIRAYDFVVAHMIRDGRLHHAWRDRRLSHLAMLDDLANMARGSLALFFVTGEDRYRAQAEAWIAEAETHFWDTEGGGFFFTADDAEALIVRTKTVADNAVPAGNGTLLRLYAKLWQLTGNAAHRDRAEGIAQGFAGELDRNIFPLSTYLNGIDSLHAGQSVTLIGPRDHNETKRLERAVLDCSRPGTFLLSVAPDAALPSGHPAAGKGMVKGRPTAYLCRGLTCLPPFTDPAKLKAALAQDAND